MFDLEPFTFFFNLKFLLWMERIKSHLIMEIIQMSDFKRPTWRGKKKKKLVWNRCSRAVITCLLPEIQ